ncbi:MAG: aminopeptidase P family N-terminal domain-containing protein, partial [Lachnospiraceae bacterium]|nr:aminopeptidase P family N-terminal domain-containing protein [Lachnospiraceae bacterium]
MKRVEKSGYARRVADLQALMEREGLDAYLVVSDDFHASEYVGDFFKCREFLSGFDGSAGEMVITRRECCLWTDGRYFLQAQDQLEGTGIRLMKMREPGVPTVSQYLAQSLSDGQTLGFDGRCVSCAVKAGLEKAFGDKSIRIRTDLDLVGELWTDRPDLSAEKAWLLDPAYTGVSRTEKLEMIR